MSSEPPGGAGRGKPREGRNMPKSYTVSDGELVLTLEPAGEGGFVVTSPDDRGLVTEADTIPEAFAMARDALRELAGSRARRLKELPPEAGVKVLSRLSERDRAKLLRGLPPAERAALQRKLKPAGRAGHRKKPALKSRVSGSRS